MTGPRLNAAFYADSLDVFLRAADDLVYAPLTSPRGYTLAPEQLSAWRLQLPVLRAAVADVAARDPEAPAPWIHLEFDIPRLGRRVDAVLVTATAVVPIEFKVGAKKFERLDYEQAWDYGLDLKNFHASSHAAAIFPILCATEAPTSHRRWKSPHADGVRPPFCANAESLGRAIALALDSTSTISSSGMSCTTVDPASWGTGSYSPTPTIIEAARSLYARHTVHDITRSDAGATNLAVTSAAVERIIADARTRGRKAIVFVTGVPGAGKTLVGLNVATRHGSRDDAAHAVFLSGNGPLVAVLREALARDDRDRARLTEPRARIGTSRSAVKAFIQNVHHFRDAMLRDPAAPADHVVVFDEAQRAWDARQLAGFMKRKKGLPGFTQTEPELLIGAMDRHADWTVVVCLVGGGQEINTGEAGIGAWLDSVRTAFPGWDVHISPQLTDSEYAAGGAREWRVEAKDFPISSTMTGVILELAPGALRELHWHPNADEWQYLLDGAVRVTLFGSRGRYREATLDAGDVGYIPQGYGHSLENVGTTPARILIVFNAGTYETIDLSQWLAGQPVDVLATTFGVPAKTFDDFPTRDVFMTGD